MKTDNNTRLQEQFQFSQSNLQDYADCARRFLLRHMKRLRWPAVIAEPSAEYEAHMRRGEAFHRMVQQYFAGVPSERILQTAEDEQLTLWWPQFLGKALNNLPETRYIEETLYTYVLGYRLVAKYDMLAIDGGKRAVILDWKTGRFRPKRDVLAHRLQTIVYPYVLAEAGHSLNGGENILPEQIEMVYWFAEHPDQPEPFQYDSKQHALNRETIESLIRTIRAESTFPLTPDERKCQYCEYRSFCNRGVAAGDFSGGDLTLLDMENDVDDGFDFDFDQIAETEF